ARQIFHKLEIELRSRTRELRPVSLGARSLHDAIFEECERLGEAGIEAEVPRDKTIVAVSRAVQQLCYQVVREAISNVIRHAHAKHVEIAIERVDRLVLLAIRDDGSGIQRDATHESSGLAGVRERLELMGGRLTIESKPGDTRLIAEIPEPA